MAAVLDESHQYFIPDRGPDVIDVYIDSTGALTGVLLMSLILWILCRSRRK